MNFIEAVKLLRLDKNIKLMRRGGDFVITIESNGVFRIDYWSNYIPSIDDILAEDWYVVKNEKLLTFEEAIVAFKEGKVIKRASCYNEHNPSDRQFIVTTDSILANDWVIMGKED